MPTKEKTVPVVKPEVEVIPLKSAKGARKDARITLFSIDDEDYSIPAEIRPNQALQIMTVFRRQGDTSGVSFMLETLLGLDAYEALLGFDDLESDDLEKIIKIAFTMVAGATENPKA